MPQYHLPMNGKDIIIDSNERGTSIFPYDPRGIEVELTPEETQYANFFLAIKLGLESKGIDTEEHVEALIEFVDRTYYRMEISIGEKAGDIRERNLDENYEALIEALKTIRDKEPYDKYLNDVLAGRRRGGVW
jgi:hypothetical protein